MFVTLLSLKEATFYLNNMVNLHLLTQRIVPGYNNNNNNNDRLTAFDPGQPG